MSEEAALNSPPIIMPRLASGRKKRWSYSSLFFSFFFFVPLVLSSPLPVSLWTVQLTGYACFVVLYIKAIHASHARLPYFLSALVVLAYVLSVHNPGGAVIFGFVAFIVGYYYRLSRGLTLIVVIVISLVLLQFFVVDSEELYLLAVTINSVVLFGFGTMERRETLFQLREVKYAESLRTLSAIAERERIGRDLHDVAGHALSSISLKAQLADKLLSKNETALAQREIKALVKLSQALLSDIRHAISDIKHLTLGDEIAKNIALLQENNFVVSADVSEQPGSKLTSLEESQLALIIKELTTNTLRHSKGRHITLHAGFQNNRFVLVYRDYGPPTTGQKFNEGNGLTGIRERARMIGAAVDIESSPSVAFSCLLTLPLSFQYTG